MDELCPSTIRTAISTIIVITGNIHQRLFLAKNENNSPTIPTRRVAV